MVGLGSKKQPKVGEKLQKFETLLTCLFIIPECCRQNNTYIKGPKPGRQLSFVEIDQEIFSTVILSLLLISEGQLSISGEIKCSILVHRLQDHAFLVKVW